MDEKRADVWRLTEADKPRPGVQHLWAFVVLIVVGTVVGTLGTIGLPVGFNISAFWPASTLQVVGGLWFGAWGVLAGTVFAIFTNFLSGGSAANVWGFIPANVAQSALTVLVFRHWRLDPALPTRRHVLVFIAVGVLLSNVLGALLGMGALLAGGELKHLADVLPFFFSWVMGNGLPCLVLGVPLLQALSPLVMDSPFFCKQWWGGSRPLRWSGSRLEDLPIAARLVLGFSIAGVLPILIVAATETVLLPDIADRISDLVLPVMLNLSIFLSLIVSGRVAQSISRRVGVLTAGAQHLGSGDLTYRVAVEGADEIGHLAQTFNQMAEDLTASREELRRTTAERERYQRELEIAHDIQQSFLPQTLPEVPGLDLAAHNIPARQVGGDFYDVIPLQGGRWGLLVADVSDKGVPAALFMALSRSLVRAYSLEYNNVPEALRAFNAFVAADNPSGMFVTLFYATLEPETGRLAYINAGHNPPVLVRGSEHQVILLRAHGIALGIWSEAKLEEHPVQLEPGDVVVLYTDGVTEAFDPDGEMFELERLIEVTRAHPTASARELVEVIEAEVATFTRGAPQSDDITLMVMRCCR